MMKIQRCGFLAVVALVAVAFHLAFFNNRIFGEVGNGSFISYGSVFQEQFLPFWSTQLSGGYPLYANAEVPLFGILNLMSFISSNVTAAFSLTYLANMVLAGVGAALLSYQFAKNKHAAALTGILYLVTGGFANSLFTSIQPYIYPLAVLPWIFLFVYKALQGNLLRNSLIAAAFLAFQLLSGGTIYFFWSFFAVGVFLATYALFAALSKPSRIFNIAVIGIILVVFTLGFSAVKLLPAAEFNSMTNRVDSVSYEDFVWVHSQVPALSFPGELLGTGFSMVRAGILVTVLALAAFLSWRRNYVVAFSTLAVVTLLIEFDTFFTRLVYLLPGFDKLRQVFTVLAVFSLMLALLAGIGWANLLKRIKFNHFAATTIILALILIELFAFGYNVEKKEHEFNFEQQLEDNELLQFVADDEDLLRFHLYGEDFVGISLSKYAVPLGIRLMDWTTGNVWFNDYSQFTSVAGQANSAKMWGIANVKYVASQDELNISGLELVKEFKPCSICDRNARFLYENKRFLPEAYTAQKTILIVGPPNVVQKFSFQFLLDNSFDPATTAFETAQQLPGNLDRYDMVMLFQGISRSEESKIASFVRNGGVVEPDILEGKITPDSRNIINFLSANSTDVLAADVLTFSPTKVEVAARESGLLVLSEKFYKFDDWKATVNGKEAGKHFVNEFSTGVFLKKGETVVFEYRPSKFFLGLYVTIAAIIIAFLLPFAVRNLERRYLRKS